MKRILVVDDERGVRDVLEGMLDFLGYQVTTASDGEEALNTVDGVFDLVITDLSMPKMDGRNLLKTIKLRSPHLAVIVVTGTRGTRAEMEALGANGYLEKPFRIAEVRNLVENTLGTS